ncbi:MAG: phage tail length tape measure family protein [Pseudomonadota bacterium]
MDIATLGIAVDSSDALTGAQNLDRLGDQAAQTERQTTQMASGVDRGMQRAGRSVQQFGRQADAARFNTANLAAQGNDVIVMALAMQNPMQLALQQGTQVSQIFNQMGGRRDIIRSLGAAFTSMVNPVSLVTIGVIAGGAALVQWALGASQADDEAEAFTKRLEEAREASKALALELRGLRLGFDQEELALYDELQQKLKELTAASAEASQIFGRDVLGATEANQRLEAAQEEVAIAQEALDTYRRQLEEKETLLNSTQAMADAERQVGEQLNLSLRDMAEIEGYSRLIAQGLDASAISALELAGVDMASPISAASIEAAQLAANLGIALNEAISLQNLRASQEYSGRGSDPRDFGDPFSRTDSGASPISTDAQSLIDRATRRSRGGSSGRSEEERAYNEMLRERDRILESLKTAQDRYNDDVAQANRLLEAGVLTQDQYNAHLRQLQVELEGAEFDSLQRGFESISDAIADAIVNGDDLGEAFQRVLRQIASDIISSNINQLLQRLFDVGSSGSSGGGILGRIISTIFNAKGNVISNGSVMAFAQGGVVNGPTMFPMSGGVGVMGEAGPEAIMPLKRGPNGDLGVQTSGAGVSVDFVVINNAQGVDVQQREESGPDGRRVLVAEVNSMVVRGELNQSLQGEFGLRKAKVRR